MSLKSGIRCSCGCRITERDVQQQGFVMSHWKPVFVYLRYRCPQCHAAGEDLINVEEWDISLLREPAELTPEEIERLAELGPIEANEIIEFSVHLSRKGTTALRELADRRY